MRKIIVALLAFLAFAQGNSQILDPVKWTTKIEKKSETNYILTFNGVIENEWHLYSQFTPEGGPLPMELIFENQKGNYKLIGKATEGKTTTAYNDVFEVNETFFVKNAKIQQEIALTNPKIKTIEVALNYQVCKQSCINLEKKFTFVIPSDAKIEVSPIQTDSTNDGVISSKTIDTPKEIANEIKKHLPGFEISYKPDFRQAIADSWPASINDEEARKHWEWKEYYNLERLCENMLSNLKK